LELHYHKLDDKSIKELRDFVRYMKTKNVAFMTLGELATGILKGAVRREGGEWLIKGPSLLGVRIFSNAES